MAIVTRDSIEWLSMMLEYSPLTDCKPYFSQIREELLSLREQVRIHEGYHRQLATASSQIIDVQEAV